MKISRQKTRQKTRQKISRQEISRQEIGDQKPRNQNTAGIRNCAEVVVQRWDAIARAVRKPEAMAPLIEALSR
jgi:hypothetical protein